MKERKPSFRISFLIGIFAAVCFIYLIRMVNIISNADPGQKTDTNTYTRRETVQAVRGEIFDRNGKRLVYNEYSYDMIFDYDAMATTQTDRNYAILQAVYALGNEGLTDHRTSSSFPFEGTYPNYRYKEEALDGESDIYYRLLKRIAENELETEAPISKTELTVSYLDDFYREEPDAFPKEQEILDWFLNRYQMNTEKSDGVSRFTDSQIDTILRVRYDMEVADFSSFTPYTFATDLDISFISYIKELPVVGADFQVQVTRKYAYPGYASHVLGYTGVITAEDWEEYKALGYDMDDVVGLAGCEYAFEEYLRGQDGVKVIVEDENGNIVESYIEKEPIPGQDVYLTIDIDLQIAAEEGLKENVDMIGDAQAGALTAIDPNSGEVLALASYPSFDLNTYRENYNELLADNARPLYNRALNGVYTPGSTFKVGMVAAGISSGTVNSSTILRCEGIYTYFDDYQPKCWYYPSAHGNVNASFALEVSCNCYFYELGRIMGIDLMNEYCRAYGLGEHTGIELSEKTGILAGPAFSSGWKPGNTIQAAIGQSDNSFTPLQLANYIATVTNGGTRYSLHLLKEVRGYGESDPTYTAEPRAVSQVTLSEDALYNVRQGMRQMVQHDAAALRYLGDLPVTVGGKTGTAQRGPGKNDNRLFVCAAPYNDPEIVISVAIEPDDSIPKDSYHGSVYASYAASKVLKAYYE